MTREINGRIRMVVSDDGTRCAAECPHRSLVQVQYRSRDGMHPAVSCDYYGILRMDLRDPACIAAEQAAASVPSCEGARHVESLATLAANAEKNLAYIHATFPGGDPRDTDWYAAEVAALVWAHKAAQAAASTGHLDGGARALDASEALREARVQGMREGLSITKGHACAYSAGEAPGCEIEIDYEDAEEYVDAAIEAVRKGER